MENAVQTPVREKLLNRNGLKILAIITMAMDHIAPIAFEANSPMWLAFRIVGRLTFPIMIYMLADGFRYTHNLKAYISRMFWFSVISIFTFSFLETKSFLPIQFLQGEVTDYAFSHIYISAIDRTFCFCSFSVITNLLLALLALTLWEKTKWNAAVKVALTIVMLAFSLFCDWSFLPITMALTFYYLKDKKVAKWTVFILLSALYMFNFFILGNGFDPAAYLNIRFKPYRLGMLLVPVVIEGLYNGKAGKKSPANKWFFYIFYPAHQVLLGIINILPL